MRYRVLLVVGVAGLLLLAGCSGEYNGSDELWEGRGANPATPTADPGTTTETDPGATTDRTAPPSDRSDPENDRIGWEDGVWYDESIAVTPEDGLNDSELDLVVDRSMARVELIRDLEFTRDVRVRVISREEYRDQNPFQFDEDPFENQLYEALFLVDEDTSAASAFEELYGGSVGGYYYADQIVIVSDSASGPVEVDRGTLAHELTHALQDQQLSLQGRQGTDPDQITAYRSLPEGEANYVMDRYQERCGGEWECLPTVERGGGGADINRGLFLTLFVPYSDGPTFVGDLIERGDWAAVNDAWDQPPTSTEQVIHPGKYPDEQPIEVRVEDRSSDDWETVTSRGRTSVTLGEASLFAMLYANGVVPQESLFGDETGRYNYSHPASAGWGGDAIRVYRNGDDFGYVFKTVWDTERDAGQFERAYVDLLEGRDATELEDGVYRIDAGGYADAFRVVRTGRTVTVVNAPTVDGLGDVRGAGGPRAANTGADGDGHTAPAPLLSP